MRKIIQKQQTLLSLTFFIVIFGISLISSSCEGDIYAEGIIYDSSTKEPIDSVKCVITPKGEIQFSDKFGKYSVSTGLVGCVPRCPDVDVEFSKPEYKTKIVTNPGKSDIFLDKE